MPIAIGADWQHLGMGHPLLDPLAARIEHDLLTRLADVRVVFKRDVEGWGCEVSQPGQPWGRVDTWFEDGAELSEANAEELLAGVAFDIANNLWPDELTDPWPLCPSHRDHPLQVEVSHGRASWVCLLDAAIAIRIGTLPSA